MQNSNLVKQHIPCNPIIINQPEIKAVNGRSRLACDIEIDGQITELWFEVGREYSKYLCPERSDAFLVALLPLAMRKRHDIKCVAPVTEELLYNITTYLIPTLAASHMVFYPSKIDAPTSSEPIENHGGVGTGISCGIDSFHTIATHFNSEYKNLKLTHLCIFNVGAFDEHPTSTAAYMEYVRCKAYEKADEVAGILGLPLIKADSNLSELRGYAHGITHTFSAAFAVFAMQKLWKTYLYASGYDFSDFTMEKSDRRDCAYYDLLLLDCFSTPQLRFYSEGGAKNRVEKTKTVADFEPAKKHLLVCYNEYFNCGHCLKCRRTLVTLDALNKLDDFRESFNIGYYKEHREEYLEWLCIQHHLGEFGLGDKMTAPVYQIMKKDQHTSELLDKIDKNLNYPVLVERLRAVRADRDRWRKYSQYFLHLLTHKNEKDNIFAFLRERGYNRIALFADTQITVFLTSIFKDTHIRVEYIVDTPRSGNIIPRYPKDTLEYPPVDAIFITDVMNTEMIREKLERLTNFPIHSVHELVKGLK